MSKWIAEFELEDGDTMPEHMDLNYKGAKIDFHCKPLEQEPILDKIRAEIEAIIGERNLDDYDFCSGLICARKILDKYKAEVEPQESEVDNGNDV